MLISFRRHKQNKLRETALPEDGVSTIDLLLGLRNLKRYKSSKEVLMESKFKILVESTKCVRCLTCALNCSFSRIGVFNPMKAYIRVSDPYPFDSVPEISFTEECDNCGICARSCPYGALNLKE